MGTGLPGGVALVTVPDWFWGGNPVGYFEAADMQAKVVKRSPLTLQVKTNERHLRRKTADLVRPLQGRGPWSAHSNLAALAALNDERIDDVTLAPARALLEKKQFNGESLPAIFSAYQLHTATAPSGMLVAQVEAGLETLSELTFDSGEQVFPDSGAMGVRRSDALVHRLKFASVQLRLLNDERLARGDVQHAKRLMSQGAAFESSAKLYEGTYLLSTYVDPLLAARSPGVWAFSASRGRGPVVFSLGRVISGISGEASEPLHNISGPGAVSEQEFGPLAAGAPWAALNWWADRLNELFSVTTDLAVFVDEDGWYQPSKHLQSLLTVEQLFNRTHSVQVTLRDKNARQVLMFTVLDTLWALTSISLERLFSAKYARNVLAGLREKVPPSAAEILLPQAEAAVEALEAVQNGFFMKNPDQTVTLNSKAGHRPVPLDRAVADYLRLLRNATHGHGANKAAAVESTDSLLVHHTGAIGNALPLLAYLYLLDFLANPERTRSVLSRQARRS